MPGPHPHFLREQVDDVGDITGCAVSEGCDAGTASTSVKIIFADHDDEAAFRALTKILVKML
jgi:hypothetical protein